MTFPTSYWAASTSSLCRNDKTGNDTCPAHPLLSNDVVITSKRCRFDVITTLLLSHVFDGCLESVHDRQLMTDVLICQVSDYMYVSLVDEYRIILMVIMVFAPIIQHILNSWIQAMSTKFMNEHN